MKFIVTKHYASDVVEIKLHKETRNTILIWTGTIIVSIASIAYIRSID